MIVYYISSGSKATDLKLFTNELFKLGQNFPGFWEIRTHFPSLPGNEKQTRKEKSKSLYS